MNPQGGASRNVFACLVHERQECVVDLVRNLRHFDPGSAILLYNGGPDANLLRCRFSVSGEEPLVHPAPKALQWGRLHEFAFDSMRLALEAVPDLGSVTIVDSDQLLVRPGYSDLIARTLERRPQIGMLGNAPGPQPPGTRVPVAAAALRERELWQSYLARFPGGEKRFPQWTFWPSTVFSAAAARDLVELYAADDDLRALLARTSIWATEEIVLPTLVDVLGHEVARSPCSYEYVQYNLLFTPQQISTAMRDRSVYWVHPVPRRYDHPLRRHIRAALKEYRRPAEGAAMKRDRTAPPLLRTLPILERVRAVEGWLWDEEADLLISATARALSEHPHTHALVEVGSYCGRSTTAIGMTVKALAPDARLFAIDPHDGHVGARDQGVTTAGPTLAKFRRALAAADIADVVEPIRQLSFEVAWDRPISFLLVDGLHDYASVSRDFQHFEPWLVEGAYIAFHDYAGYYPGVQTLVDEVVATGRYEQAALAGSLVVLRKLVAAETEVPRPAAPAAEPKRALAGDDPPFVSCVMPTYGRPAFAANAIALFQRQDYDRCELIVVDDGPEPLDGVPDDPRVRYLRLDARHTIGAKRNLACETAIGDVLANWDDDDWYAPWRLRYQVESLAADGADVCGLRALLYYEPATRRAWRYEWPPDQRAWLADPTLVYTREFWARNPFPDTSMGIDCRLLWNDQPKRLLTLEDETFFVGVVHSGNTSPKDIGHAVWQPLPPERLEELVGDEALAALASAAGAGSLVGAAR